MRADTTAKMDQGKLIVQPDKRDQDSQDTSKAGGDDNGDGRT